MCPHPDVAESLRHLHVCVDRAPTPKPFRDRLAFASSRKWGVNTLHVRFLDVPDVVRGRIVAAARPWQEALSGRLAIYFDDAEAAEIRIACTQSGHWSYVGTECSEQPLGAPTMNFANFSALTDPGTLQRVVLHEFGHALGCVHEFLSPAAGINWNEEAVFAFYAGPPNFWSQEKTRQNVLDQYDESVTARTEFDPDSIMMYPIAPELTRDGRGYEWRSKLSASDVAFIQQMYPAV